MQTSRINKVTKNATVSSVCKVIDLILNFIVRTLFIKYLSEEYLGINGLFGNVLMLLSFAELGIGNAITYSLYKPIANEDKEKIKSIMNLFKVAYRIIATVVLIIGFALVPIIKWLIPIEQIPHVQENIVVIYLIYLFNTVTSYFFTFKQTLIIADQKQYVVSIFSEISSIISAIVRCIVLVLTRNYLLYLIIQSIILLAGNYILAKKIDREYPILKEKHIYKLEKNELQEIINNVRAMFVFKIGNVIFSGTDNIIIAKIVNIVTVGIASQYTLIINSISSVIGQLLNAFTASIGNINAIENDEHKERVFYQVMFLCFWIYSFICSGIFVCVDDLIVIWIGEKCLLSKWVILALVSVLFFDGLSFVTYTYRITFGLFRKAVYIPILSSLINVFLSIILGKIFGLAGIYFATAIARILVNNLIDSYLVTKCCFHKTALKYHILYIRYTVFTIINTVICAQMISFLPLKGIFQFMLKIILYTIAYNIVFVICNYKDNNFKYIKSLVFKMFYKSN